MPVRVPTCTEELPIVLIACGVFGVQLVILWQSSSFGPTGVQIWQFLVFVVAGPSVIVGFMAVLGMVL